MDQKKAKGDPLEELEEAEDKVQEAARPGTIPRTDKDDSLIQEKLLEVI